MDAEDVLPSQYPESSSDFSIISSLNTSSSPHPKVSAPHCGAKDFKFGTCEYENIRVEPVFDHKQYCYVNMFTVRKGNLYIEGSYLKQST